MDVDILRKIGNFDLNFLPTWSWISNLQNCEKIPLYFLSHPFLLLWQQTNTLRITLEVSLQQKIWILYIRFLEVLQCSSVQSLSHVQLFVTPWTAACQASLYITNSQSLLKLMPIESVMPSNHLTLCHPALLPPSIFPSIRVFSNESAFASGGQSIGVSVSASVLPMNIQDWFPLGWSDWISLQSKGLSRVFSNTTVQKHQFFSAQLSSQSNSHIHTWPQEKP